MKIEVRLSENEFLRFSWFDVLRHRKLWRSPAIFAAILSISALACFRTHETQGAVMLGAVLLTTGLGVPAAYFGSFSLSLRKQVRERKLGDGKYVYTLNLSDSGISVSNGLEHTVYPWDRVFHAYCHGDSVYLYITSQHAFLIPQSCIPGGAECLWRSIRHWVPAERRTAS